MAARLIMYKILFINLDAQTIAKTRSHCKCFATFAGKYTLINGYKTC